VVLERQIVSNLTAAGVHAGGGTAGVIGATGKLPPPVADPVAAAFSHTFWWSVVAILIAFVPTLFLPNRAPAPSATRSVSGGDEDGAGSEPRIAPAALD